jgi:hypothetical protein
MNFIEAYKKVESGEAGGIRRKGKPSHVGSSGKVWLDPYWLIGHCTHAFLNYMCIKPHLTPEDIIAEDWEVR